MARNPDRRRDAAEPGVDDEGDLNPQSGTKLVRSLCRALDILSCFDVEHPSWDLPALSRNANVHKATVYRLAKTLGSKGFLTLDPATGKYHPGPALMRIAYTGLSGTELVRVALPHMRRLASETGETVDVGVWTGDGALLVAQVLTSRPFKPAASVGRFFPDLANAGSKIFLAFMSEEERAKLLARPQQRFTPFTKTDPRALAAEISRVAVEGIAYDLQETSLGIAAVAAPVRDATGQVTAAIAVVCPSERFSENEVENYVRSLRATASALSLDLGYQDKKNHHGAHNRRDVAAQVGSGGV